MSPAEATLRQAIVDEARRWIGTPYRHQGRQRTVAVDCIGLIFGVCEAVGLGDAAFWQGINAKWGAYKRIPQGNLLLDRWSLHAPQVPPHQAQPGDVLLIAVKGEPRHTAILSERNTLIHATWEAKQTCETTWTDDWRGNTVTAFQLIGLRT